MMSLFCYYALPLRATVLARFLALCNPLSLVRRPVLFQLGPGPGSAQVMLHTCVFFMLAKLISIVQARKGVKSIM